jgi:hypothetical protein
MPEKFRHDHRELLTSKLAQKVDELEVVNQRLTALIEVGQQLATERDTARCWNSIVRRLARLSAQNMQWWPFWTMCKYCHNFLPAAWMWKSGAAGTFTGR